MNDINDACAVSPEELKARHRQCWSPQCSGWAFIEDWAGWKWCLRCFCRNVRWGGGNKWFAITRAKIF
jgi:hypothetical protein